MTKTIQSKFVAISLIIILGVIVYINSLDNGFVYDDLLVVEGNAFIASWKNFPSLFNEHYYLGSGETSWRVIVTLTYFIDYTLWKFNPSGYHLTNLIFHISNGILFYFFLLNLIPFIDDKIVNKSNLNYFPLPLISALIFILHPLQTEAVNSIGFRHEVVFSFFFFSSLIFYLKAKDVLGKRRFIFYIFSLFLYLLSMLSKEMAMVLPLMILVIELINWFKDKTVRLLRRANILGYSGYFITLGIYIFIRFFWIVKPDEKLRGVTYGVAFLGGNLYTCLLTTSRIFTSYLKLLLFPINLSTEHIVSISKSVFEPRVVVSIFILVMVFILILRSFRYSGLFTFSGFWIFIPFIAVSNIVPLHHPMAERYLYLSCAGFSLFTGLAYTKIIYNRYLSTNLKRTVILILIIILSLYSIRTFTRNKIWRDKETFWKHEVLNKPGPHRARSYSNLGLVYYREGNYDEAEKWFRKSLETSPYYSQVHNNLGLIYFKKGEYNKAIGEFKQVAELDPSFMQVNSNLCLSYLRAGDLDKAFEYGKKALRGNPYLAEAHSNLGQVYLAKKKPDKAIESFKKALELNPHLLKTYFNLSRAYLTKDMTGEAINVYKKVLRLTSHNFEAYFNLALLYSDIEDYHNAIKEYQNCLNIRPGSALVYYNLALIYYKREDYGLAYQYLKKAEQLGHEIPTEFITSILYHKSKTDLPEGD